MSVNDRARLILAWVAALLACDSGGARPPTPLAPAPTGADLAPSDLTYGVYLNGAKVGWMRSTVSVGATVEMTTELHASVGGMGRVSQIELEERRGYAGPDGALASLSFVQKAATGAVRVFGRRDGKDLTLEVTAGNATQTQRFPVTETLADALAARRLAKTGKPGDVASATHFDPSLQRTLVVAYRVVAVETRMLAGVPARTVRIDATYQELGVTETSWLDPGGKVLETQVGGFFVARLEPPEVARKLDFRQDLLAAAVVKTPRPISAPERLERLTVTFRGFGEITPPASERQRVERRGDEIVLGLTRDPALPRVTLAALTVPAAVRPELAPTPFIQSDARAVREAARAAAAGAELLPDVITRLSGFVFRHVQDEYVPAYSNALEALATRRGDCTEHSVLFVALARSLGVPARVAVGIAYWPPGGGFGWHAWAEVWAQGRWYSVDPTWDQPIADATHVKLAGGGPAEQASIVMLLGRLRVTELEG